MKIIDKFYSFIHIPMARKCKDCPKQDEVINEQNKEVMLKDEELKPVHWKKGYFFPNEWITIYANSYKEALNILNSTKQ